MGHTIWSGTVDRCGLTLSVNNGLTWKYFTTEDGLASNHVNSIGLRKEEVWVGTDQGLNYSTDQGKTWRLFTSIQDRLPGNDVRAIAFQGKRVWVGTTNGIGYINSVGDLFTNFRVTDGMSDNHINHIFVDCNQTCIWVSTNNGISFTNDTGNTWKIIRSDRTGLSSNIVNAITRYKGALYVATADGLNVSADEGQTFVPIRAPRIGDNIVFSLKVDGADLWIGTNNGLTKYSDGKFTTYRREGVFSEIGQQLSTTNIGLKSNVIQSLAQ
jgi:ligand-binding sensor domain-containing protein